jgi:8-oxo-dGTP diphosphatase
MGAAGQGADGTRWLASPRTLVFVIDGGDVLLMKRGPHKRVFPDMYNGLGGHVERDEDVYTAAAREVREESGLAIRDLRLRGIHHIDAGTSTGVLVFVFTAACDTRKIIDSDEGALEWVATDRLAELSLVEDIPIVLRRVLSMSDTATPYAAHVSYNASDEIVIRFADEASPTTR